MVDDADFDRLMEHKWYFASIGYAVRTSTVRDIIGRGKRIYMHRAITGASGHLQEVDHINHDKLDNRRDNLRLATSRQNKCNKGLRRDNTSGFKGVSWEKNQRRWQAVISLGGGRKKWLGYYDDKKAAYSAFRSAATEIYGEFALV